MRILIADDHEVVRIGLRAILEGQPDCTIVEEVADGRSAIEAAKRTKPDIVLMDVSMPELNGIEATRRIRSEIPETQVLVLTVHGSEELIQELLTAGAQGYLLKSDAGNELLAALQSIMDGKPYLTARAARVVLNGFLQSGAQEYQERRLSSREREVVQLLAEGKTNKEVATILGITPSTAETHRNRIMRKLGCKSIVDLVRYAIRNRIVEA